MMDRASVAHVTGCYAARSWHTLGMAETMGMAEEMQRSTENHTR
jgi:hypothetical protein